MRVNYLYRLSPKLYTKVMYIIFAYGFRFIYILFNLQKGTLRISTPDFSQMQKLYNSKKFNLENFLGPLYGKMKMKNKFIYHKTVYDKESLSALLNNIGFRNIKEWSYKNVSHGNFDDHSQVYLPHFDKKNGTLISVNLECVK